MKQYCEVCGGELREVLKKRKVSMVHIKRLVAGFITIGFMAIVVLAMKEVIIPLLDQYALLVSLGIIAFFITVVAYTFGDLVLGIWEDIKSE